MVVVQKALHRCPGVEHLHIGLIEVGHGVRAHELAANDLHVRKNLEDHVIKSQAIVAGKLPRLNAEVSRHVGQVLVIIHGFSAGDVVKSVDGTEEVTVVPDHQQRATWEDDLLLLLLRGRLTNQLNHPVVVLLGFRRACWRKERGLPALRSPEHNRIMEFPACEPYTKPRLGLRKSPTAVTLR